MVGEVVEWDRVEGRGRVPAGKDLDAWEDQRPPAPAVLASAHNVDCGNRINAVCPVSSAHARSVASP